MRLLPLLCSNGELDGNGSSVPQRAQMEGMFFSFIYCKKYIFDLIIDAAASRSIYIYIYLYINEIVVLL